MIGWHDNDKMESKDSGVIKVMNRLSQVLSELEQQASRFEEKLQFVCFPPSPPNPKGAATAPINPSPLTTELLGLAERLVALRVYYESIIGRLDL